MFLKVLTMENLSRLSAANPMKSLTVGIYTLRLVLMDHLTDTSWLFAKHWGALYLALGLQYILHISWVYTISTVCP